MSEQKIEVGHIVRFKLRRRWGVSGQTDESYSGVVVYILCGFESYEVAAIGSDGRLSMKLFSLTKGQIDEIDVLQTMSMYDRDLLAEWYAEKSKLVDELKASTVPGRWAKHAAARRRK